MYFQRNFVGLTALIMTFVAAAFILAPRMFPKQYTQAELEKRLVKFADCLLIT